jgi:uncharacterized protein DUF3592
MAESVRRASVARASIGVLLVIAGIALAMMAYAADRRERALREGAVRATGTVVGVLKRQSGNAPLVRFTTATGDKVDFTATDARSAKYAIGDTVTLFYHPDHPGLAGLDRGASRWGRVATLGVVGVLLAAAGVKLTWSTR